MAPLLKSVKWAKSSHSLHQLVNYTSRMWLKIHLYFYCYYHNSKSSFITTRRSFLNWAPTTSFSRLQFCPSCSLLYLQYLAQCLGYSTCSICLWHKDHRSTYFTLVVVNLLLSQAPRMTLRTETILIILSSSYILRAHDTDMVLFRLE